MRRKKYVDNWGKYKRQQSKSGWVSRQETRLIWNKGSVTEENVWERESTQ